MDWNPDEISQAAGIAERLAEPGISCEAPFPASDILCLSLSDAGRFVPGLNWPASDLLPEGKVVVRQLCHLLGFDEHWPFRVRLEHKLVQAHVLNHFCPGSVPVTCGLRRYLSSLPQSRHGDAVRGLISEGRVVKPALGFGRSAAEVGNVGQAVSAAISDGKSVTGDLAQEEWVIQDRIPVAEEYRVHSLEASVVEDLTFTRHSGRPVRLRREGPNSYVQSVLERLPKSCIRNLLCGWDIAAMDGGFKVIEMNIAGFHPVSRTGYQVSGFFQDRTWGPAVVARLIRFVEEKYGVAVQFTYGDEDPHNLLSWYRSVELWSEFLRVSRRIVRLSAAVDERSGVEAWEVDLHNVLVEMLQRLKHSVELVE